MPPDGTHATHVGVVTGAFVQYWLDPQDRGLGISAHFWAMKHLVLTTIIIIRRSYTPAVPKAAASVTGTAISFIFESQAGIVIRIMRADSDRELRTCED